MQLSIVSYLDSAATSQVRLLQQALSEITGSRASLDSWQPHITLGDGVEVTESELDTLTKEIQQTAKSTSPLTISMSGFSALESRPIGASEVSTPYALFIDVTMNQELTSLVSKIDTVTSQRTIWYHMPRPYLPHVTLAFRDLSEAGYHSGLAYLSSKDIQISSTIDNIALVERQPHTDCEVIRVHLV